MSAQPSPQRNGILPHLDKYLFIHPSVRAEFARHVSRWLDCQQCPLHQGRRNTALFRGYLPCDVLFIGEAPGDSEDNIGVPFIGPAGKKFDAIRQEAWLQSVGDSISVGSKPLVTWGITNIVACFPRNPPVYFGSGEIREPEREEAAACQPRLLEIIKIAKPKRVILLGDIAKRYWNRVGYDIKSIHVIPMVHPSRILRLEDEAPRAADLMEKKMVLALTEILRSL